MKYIYLLIFNLISFQTFSQITIRGAKNIEIVTTNKSKEEVKKNNENDTNSKEEEKNSPKYITQDDIKTSDVKTSETNVEITISDIDSAKELKDNEKKQIIISLDQAKNSIDSIEDFKKPETVSESIIEQNEIQKTEIITQETFKVTETTKIEEEGIKITEPETQSKGIFIESSTEESTTVKEETIENKSESDITFKTKKTIIVEESETVETKTNLTTELEKTETYSEDETNLNNSITDTNTEGESPNPKKGSWSVSLRAGIPAILGDVNSKAGYGTSLSVQKAIGHMFSLRFQALFLETFGLNTKLNTYQNYKTRFSDYTLQGVFTLNNLSFYTKQPKVLYNIIIGGGMATRYTWTDLKDENNMFYNFDNLSTSDAKSTRADIMALLDKDYETHIPKDVDKMSIKNTNILPSILFGFGIDFRLSEKIDLNLETRFSNHFDDNLDAYKNGNSTDWMSFTSIGLSYKFVSKNKSLRWTNPVYSKVEEINELKEKVKDGDLLKDEDKDGIADIFDQDLNTPEKVAVDSRGVPSDMDKDGVADYLDAQPFTPIGAKVDEKGRAIDSDNDGVADILDLEPNTKSGNQVDANGRAINPKSGLSSVQSNSDFDLIFFDENSSRINKDFYSTLYKVARYIQANPNAKVEIIGYTDVLSTENYNLNLSEKRANAVYSMLVEMFKISPKNLITNFKGENNPIIEGLPEQKDASMTAAYYINRRVELKIKK